MRASELIQELVMQIAQYGDMPIKVMSKKGYQGSITITTMVKPPPNSDDHSFMYIYADGGFSGEEKEGGGGDEGFYDDDVEKPSNEGFMLMPDGTRNDHFLLKDDKDFEWPLDYQITAAQEMRDQGYSDDVIAGCYPLGLAELNK